ncbi:ABC transporter substrate-binding protein [Neobacillus drentensis]|uniref:ABC transporter substrate-binding protein n=1 Tax=Neobacillus drentensis TaxID=220684 RepID=UPI0030014409
MNKMKKISGPMVACITALSLMLTACGNSAQTTSTKEAAAPKQDGKKIVEVHFSEVIRSIFYAPHYIAMEKGFFRDEGLKVDMMTSQGSDKGAAALLSGTADISLVGPESAVFIFNQHGKQSLKVFYQLTATDGSFLMARNPKTPFQWSDLNGQAVVSWRPGSSPEMVMSQVLKKNQVRKSKLITNIASPAMVGAFESGKGEYIQVYEPLASMLEQSGKARLVASMGKAIGSYPETSYVATDEFIKKNPEIIQKWSNAVYKATQWLNEHSAEEAAAALEPYFKGTSKELIQKSVERYAKQNSWAKNPVLDQAQLDTLQDILVDSGVLPSDQKVKHEDIVETTFAEKAVQEGN